MPDIYHDLQQSFVRKAEWSWTKEAEHKGRVHQWIHTIEEWQQPMENIDVVLLGLPLSRSSISVSGASEYPLAFRKGWKGFQTYNIEEEVDLASLRIVDLGDVNMHGTDIAQCHERIEQATSVVARNFANAVSVNIGGDHSVTACTVRGLNEIYPHETIGILQFDTHLDLRDPSQNGPSNGTPIRQLIEGDVIKGENVYNIGLHGYFNSSDLVQYGKEHGVNMITLKKARQQGMKETVRASLAALKEKVDRIYVTVDMDVLDVSFAPGVPASTPGGMTTHELFDALLEVGKDDRFQHIDFVCLDPLKDGTASPTVKAGVYSFLQVMTGIVLAKKGD
ncbi:agmatinase family protein [Jeotgalibacillus marinus]|uniref:Agmatinase family protein n=1 Tax=Jeotgalibacillus marinus TaxID=86667 RepID=A0ABV3Q188_9BACL